LQVPNSKKQTSNSNEAMENKLTRQRGMTEENLENLQNATIGPTTCKVDEQQTSEQPQSGPTAATRPQLSKVESNNNNQYRTNQQKSIDQWSSNAGEKLHCPNSLQATLYQQMEVKCIVTQL
jgi:hypothetical protein